jgi:hypothetical protein
MKLPELIETKTIKGAELAAAEIGGATLGEFLPRRFLSNGHLMTIVGNYIPRVYALPQEEPWFVEVEPASEERRSTVLRCDCDWQPIDVRRERLTVVLLHGLEGSSRSQYILGTATRAWAAGCNVVRMNMRSCGGTDELSPGIYHSGRSEDVAAVVDGLVREQGLREIALVGFSMGGNLVLKYAGERSSTNPLKPAKGLNGAPIELCAVVGISPLMDLAASSKALHQRANRIYERRFLRNMVARFKKKVEIFPEIYSSSAAEAIQAIRSANSMRAFDQEVVARYAPFADADDYYRTVASSRWASEFAVPTLIIHALDDPFIRMLPSTREALLGNEHVTFVETRHGGHCAFLAPGKGSERHWAEKSLVNWLLGVVGTPL